MLEHVGRRAWVDAHVGAKGEVGLGALEVPGKTTYSKRTLRIDVPYQQRSFLTSRETARR